MGISNKLFIAGIAFFILFIMGYLVGIVIEPYGCNYPVNPDDLGGPFVTGCTLMACSPTILELTYLGFFVLGVLISATALTYHFKPCPWKLSEFLFRFGISVTVLFLVIYVYMVVTMPCMTSLLRCPENIITTFKDWLFALVWLVFIATALSYYFEKRNLKENKKN